MKPFIAYIRGVLCEKIEKIKTEFAGHFMLDPSYWGQISNLFSVHAESELDTERVKQSNLIALLVPCELNAI